MFPTFLLYDISVFIKVRIVFTQIKIETLVPFSPIFFIAIHIWILCLFPILFIWKNITSEQVQETLSNIRNYFKNNGKSIKNIKSKGDLRWQISVFSFLYKMDSHFFQSKSCDFSTCIWFNFFACFRSIIQSLSPNGTENDWKINSKENCSKVQNVWRRSISQLLLRFIESNLEHSNSVKRLFINIMLFSFSFEFTVLI